MTEQRYRVTDWQGFPNYECAACPFASLDEGELFLHIARRHQPAAATFRETGLVDSRGNPIMVEEV